MIVLRWLFESGEDTSDSLVAAVRWLIWGLFGYLGDGSIVDVLAVTR